MKSKSLVKKMIHKEAVDYILKNPRFQIPDGLQAEQINDADHDRFWVTEYISGRYVVYLKKEQKYEVTHPLMKENVVLVRKENA